MLGLDALRTRIGGLSWPAIQRFRALALSIALVMTMAGNHAMAQSVEGVTEEGISITLKVFAGCLVSVGGLCLLIGQWSTRRILEAKQLAQEQAAQAARQEAQEARQVALERRIEALDHELHTLRGVPPRALPPIDSPGGP